MCLSETEIDARGEGGSRNQFSLTCMKYGFTSLEGRFVNGSFDQIVSENCKFEDVFSLAGVGYKNWGEKEKSSHDTFELFWGNKLNVNGH